MNIGLHVMHTPGADRRRDENVEALVGHGFNVHQDRNRDGLMTTWLRALRNIEERGEEWQLLVTDDAVPFKGWRSELAPMLAEAGHPIIGLTHFGTAGQKAAAAGFAFGRHGVWGPAVVMHELVVPELVTLAEEVLDLDPTYPHDDGIIWMWSQRHREDLIYTARAFFDHAPWPSIMGHGGVRDQRRPLLSLEDSGPMWTTPGEWGGFKPYLSKRTTALIEELGLARR